MRARVTVHINLSDADTGDQLVTATPLGRHVGLQRLPGDDRYAVYIGGTQFTILGTADQLHLLAAGISNAINALTDTGGDGE